MKVKHIIFILYIFSLAACGPKGTIHGTWISSYLINKEGKKHPIAAKKIIRFTKDSIFIRGLRTHPNYNLEQKYKINGNQIEVHKEIIKIAKISKDSLVLLDDNGYVLIYNRLTDNLKYRGEFKLRGELKLRGESFQIMYPFSTDTISFINDSVLVNKNYGIERYWEFIKYNDFAILMIDDTFDLPFILKSFEGKALEFIIFDSGPKSVIFTKISE